ncbi:response regulator [Halomonas sp. 3H]|uniref:response regulator n=1 Tax=Halomonas sp. 3H TaxID=2952527 RepID=UPI0020B6B132|nr:response regulator [Halomonas sp. 3H]
MPSSAATILVIDDDATIRLLLSAGLSKQGFHVLEAAGGPAGLAAFRTRRPDLVLIDVSMPGMDGFQVARAIGSESSIRTVPLVMLTGSDEPDIRRQAFEAGALDILTKPFQLLPLAERLRNLLGSAA